MNKLLNIINNNFTEDCKECPLLNDCENRSQINKKKWVIFKPSRAPFIYNLKNLIKIIALKKYEDISKYEIKDDYNPNENNLMLFVLENPYSPNYWIIEELNIETKKEFNKKFNKELKWLKIKEKDLEIQELECRRDYNNYQEYLEQFIKSNLFFEYWKTWKTIRQFILELWKESKINEDTYIWFTNTVKCQTREVLSKVENKKEIEKFCSNLLTTEIRITKPSLIISIWNTAKKAISKLKFDKNNMLHIWHPSYWWMNRTKKEFFKNLKNKI